MAYGLNSYYEPVERAVGGEDVVVKIVAVDADGNTSTLGATAVTDTVPAGESLDSFEYRLESGAKKIVTLTAQVDGGDAGTDQTVSECLEDNNEEEWKENLCTD